MSNSVPWLNQVMTTGTTSAVAKVDGCLTLIDLFSAVVTLDGKRPPNAVFPFA